MIENIKCKICGKSKGYNTKQIDSRNSEQDNEQHKCICKKCVNPVKIKSIPCNES